MTDSQFNVNGETNGGGATAAPSPEAAAAPAVHDAPVEGEAIEIDSTPDQVGELEALVSERTADLQRLHAEYANYKKRVDRDRDLARQAGVASVLQDFMPVLDSIALAKQHEDLAGGFRLVADEVEKAAAKNGLVSFGEVGDVFDPSRHEALMTVQLEAPVEVTTVSQVIQQGYELSGRVLRPARVAVATP